MKKQKGFIALVTVMIAGAVGTAIAISLLMLGLGTSRSSFAIIQSGQAKGLADACIEDAMQRIRDSQAYTGTSTLTLGQGTCTATVTSGGGQARTITSSATVGTIVRKVTVAINAISPKLNVTSWQEIQ